MFDTVPCPYTSAIRLKNDWILCTNQNKLACYMVLSRLKHYAGSTMLERL